MFQDWINHLDPISRFGREFWNIYLLKFRDFKISSKIKCAYWWQVQVSMSAAMFYPWKDYSEALILPQRIKFFLSVTVLLKNKRKTNDKILRFGVGMRVTFSRLNYLQHLNLPSNSPFNGMFASRSLYKCLKKQESLPKHEHHYVF